MIAKPTDLIIQSSRLLFLVDYINLCERHDHHAESYDDNGAYWVSDGPCSPDMIAKFEDSMYENFPVSRPLLVHLGVYEPEWSTRWNHRHDGKWHIEWKYAFFTQKFYDRINGVKEWK